MPQYMRANPTIKLSILTKIIGKNDVPKAPKITTNDKKTGVDSNVPKAKNIKCLFFILVSTNFAVNTPEKHTIVTGFNIVKINNVKKTFSTVQL